MALSDMTGSSKNMGRRDPLEPSSCPNASIQNAAPV